MMSSKTLTMFPVLLLIATTAWAEQKEATIAYDVALREFTCWREGPLTTDAKLAVTKPADPKKPCAAENWHPITGDTYFVRGQVLTLLLVNGVAADLFSLEVKAEDLPEPGTPIFGEAKDLPKMLPLPPSPALVFGPGASFVSGTGQLRAIILRLLVTTTEEKDLRAWLKQTLIDPASAREVLDLLAVDVAGTVATADLRAPQLLDAAGTITGDLNTVAKPTSMVPLVTEVKKLARIFEGLRAFREHTAIAAVAVLGKSISDAVRALQSPAVASAARLKVDELRLFENHFNNAFPVPQRFSLIKAIVVQNGKFAIPNHNVGQPLNDFLAELTQAAGGSVQTGDEVRVRANLSALAELWADIASAIDRYRRIEELGKLLNTYKTSAKSLYKLQEAIDAMASLAVGKATMLNTRARELPIDEPYDVVPVGFWFGSKEIALSLKQGQRLVLFDVGGAGETSRISVTGGETGAAKSMLTPPADLATVRSLRLRVYNMYRFQIGMGFLYSGADDRRFEETKQTIGSGDTAVTQLFIDQVRDRNYNLLATVDVMFFPKARHRFPFRPRYEKEPKPSGWNDVGAMLGFSMTNPNRDFLVGAVWFPRSSPVGLKGGWHLALRDLPPDGYEPGTPLTTRSVVLKQRVVHGVYAGLSFNTDFFVSTFAQIFKP